MKDWIGVWSTVENNKRKFYVGRHPRDAALVGQFKREYNPNTGRDSVNYSYTPMNHQPQPNGRWLYRNTPG